VIISLIKPNYNSINKRLDIHCNVVEVPSSSLNYILDFHLLDTSIIPLENLGFIVLFFLPPTRDKKKEPCFTLILSIQYFILSFFLFVSILMFLFDWSYYRWIQELTCTLVSLVETWTWIKYLVEIISRDRIILVKPHLFSIINANCFCLYVQGIGYQASSLEYATMQELR